MAHPDLRAKVRRAELMRYGHAMSVPVPGLRGSAALLALGDPQPGRVHFAHSDLAGYSVFEEAFTWGATVAGRVPRRCLPPPARGIRRATCRAGRAWLGAAGRGGPLIPTASCRGDRAGAARSARAWRHTSARRRDGSPARDVHRRARWPCRWPATAARRHETG